MGGFGGRGTTSSGGYTMVFGGPGGTRTVRVQGQTGREGAGGEDQRGRIPTLFEYTSSTHGLFYGLSNLSLDFLQTRNRRRMAAQETTIRNVLRLLCWLHTFSQVYYAIRMVIFRQG